MQAVLSLGSNLGNKHHNLDRALKLINELEATKIVKYSKYLNTKAWGLTDQGDFLNCAVIIETKLDALLLLNKLLDIELYMGRVRTLKWGPRLIDIDIIFYENLIINSDDLVIPHPLMQERDFVLSCLDEICPGYLHPLLKKDIRTLNEELNNNLKIQR